MASLTEVNDVLSVEEVEDACEVLDAIQEADQKE